MKLLKRALSAAVCTALALSLSACGDDMRIIEDTPCSTVRFSWWGKDNRTELTLEGIYNYEDKNPTVDILPEYGEFTGMKARIYSEFNSDTEADVMQINYDWLYDFSSDGEGFYNLDELSDYIDLSNFEDKVLDFGRVNGKLNAIPISFNAVTFIYNKMLFYSYGIGVPETWDDLFEAAEIMSKDGIYPLSLSEKNFWLCCVAYNAQMTGHEVFDSDNNLTLTRDDLKSMIDFYVELVDKKVTQSAENFIRSDFENGICAGVACWASDSAYYNTAAEEAGFTAGIGEYPTTDDCKAYGWYAKPSAMYAIKKTTDNPTEAAEFVDYLLNSSDMNAIMGTTNGFPVSKSALETLESRDMLTGIEYESSQQISESEGLTAMSPYLENDEIINAFIEAAYSVCYDGKTSDEAADKAFEEISAIFSA